MTITLVLGTLGCALHIYIWGFRIYLLIRYQVYKIHFKPDMELITSTLNCIRHFLVDILCRHVTKLLLNYDSLIKRNQQIIKRKSYVFYTNILRNNR